jgi:UDP-N-acetyl-D-mannosaminuronate dehydrogenase
VGLPLAVEFGKKRPTLGFDLSPTKIESYRRFIDPTGEMSSEDLRAACSAHRHKKEVGFVISHLFHHCILCF